MRFNLYKKILLPIILVIVAILVSKKYFINQNIQNIGVTNDFADGQWFSVTDFQGFQTKLDPSKISNGGSPNGQNTTVNNGDRISVREYGYTILGTVTTTENPVLSLHTFRKRSGENILIRNRGTYLEYFESGNSLWESLRTTSTQGVSYDFADYNINTDLRSYVYFGNGVDEFARWTGAHSLLNGAVSIGAGSIVVDDTTDFTATGTLRYCDVNIDYTSKTATTFTLSGTSVVNCDDNRGITQAIQGFPSNPRGNIYLVANNRIFIAGVTSTPQAVYFSKYGDATTYLTTLVADNTADAAGIFNLGEGGGQVNGMTQDESAIYIFKRSIIYKATLSDSLYTLTALKPFDGKSQTTGSLNGRTVFTGGNGVFFITADKQIMNLTRIEGVDYPQILPISDIIKPTVDALSFTSSTGITYKDKIYISVKSNSDGFINDSILVFNNRTNQWDTPIVGWSANSFTIYDDGDGEKLYFGDVSTANVYQVITDEKLDNGYSFSASWRSKQFNFSELGIPLESQKEITDVYVEGYITDNTTLNISLLLDENGTTQTFTTHIYGGDTDFLFNSQPFNLFGLHPFGYLPFGTNQTIEKQRFRVYLNKEFRASDFYTAQLEFASDEENNFWEITGFGFKVREATQPEKRTLFKSFK